MYRLVEGARRAFPSLLMPLVVGGCALLPSLPPPQTPLLPPSAVPPHAASQVLDVAFRDREFSLQCAVQTTPELLTMVALGPLGQRAFTLRYDGHRVDADLSPYVPKNLPPARILADLELALWPLDAWQQAFPAGDWKVSEPHGGLRRLYYRGRLIEEVHYAEGTTDPWNGRLWLVNLALGYTLDIQSSPQ